MILALRKLGRLKQKDEVLEVNLGYTQWDPDPENTNFKRHLSLHWRIAPVCLSRKNPVTDFCEPRKHFLGFRLLLSDLHSKCGSCGQGHRCHRCLPLSTGVFSRKARHLSSSACLLSPFCPPPLSHCWEVFTYAVQLSRARMWSQGLRRQGLLGAVQRYFLFILLTAFVFSQKQDSHWKAESGYHISPEDKEDCDSHRSSL